ncbi:phytoene desaturase family protein [Nesterenkonia xinjiangensis]|uniref:Pyridine nucleotide-disulfide oxidoreductase domain-containing protein 2 n=1 Tax=Nesterenkonia xinjiangensis TaxID=225327 RepID=A0A7Z0GMS6_9MICC|nr:NAD(P)/FAD-dependent oxidoreductase [Nesterenkonia xinjiangensis]NYJ77773.1 phytoene dehydrogenase-like protein [Nesterenkonia xinjiangensis]
MAGHRAAVVGSGPNGLTAACVLARAGWEVTVYETADAPGGALRSAEVLGDGVISDLGASVHPFGVGSPAFEDLRLAERGLSWAHPEIPAAHTLDDEPPALLHSSLEQTAAELGVDHDAWRRLIGPVVAHWEEVRRAAMAPPLRTFGHRSEDSVVARGAALARLGLRGAWPADVAARLFRTPRARALFAGMAAHSTVPFSHPLTAAFGVLFGAAGHATGWPVARGGSQAIVDALTGELEHHGGRIETGFEVTGVRRAPGRLRRTHLISGRRRGPGGGRAVVAEEAVDVVLCDLTPTQLLRLDGLELPSRYRHALRRWTYGPAIVKVDYLIDGTIPWAHPDTARAGTVHLGGSHAQISASEAAAARGVLSGRPYVLLTQPSAADDSRAPAGQSVVWAYAHVPHGLEGPAAQRAAELIDAEIAVNAPGFREAVLARQAWTPQDLESMNANLVGGTISGGMPTVRQFVARPALSLQPYRTGTEGIWLCSSSTPPGGGAHGMNGHNAAQAVLRALG